ncbi:hypothetical protein C7I87_06780 [Mesorhizobium sp. SARCC-RB16n]|uniref:DedA family protein n=1 Tax=Mesorhizobium sp. SARCC-RB16n TaxID=2116687 RepID=UPI00122EE35C|nr:hypothetical protein C7I87_06780 [Mesorhizobium sp. SARCC-RB16n]
MPRGHKFFERWGGPGVFVGRFSGPLRASAPVFQIANISSAILWVTGILAPGAFGLKWLQQWM